MRIPIVLLLIVLAFTSCKDDALPKPKAFLALSYPEAVYDSIEIPCPYQFEINRLANITKGKSNGSCSVDLVYPLLDGAIFLTYREVNNNLDSLLSDAQKLPLQHTIKADYIETDVYTNPEHKVYGMFYEVDGNAASQAQFYITDSTRHFLTGSLYFNHKPNFDSILPAAAYLKADMRHLMESIKWK